MPFAATSSRTGGTALIRLEGELDALTAPTFAQEVDRAAEGEVDRLVLDMTDLTYLSSAGLRALVFARQKMADDVKIVLVAVNEEAEQTIRLVGFHQSVIFSELSTKTTASSPILTAAAARRTASDLEPQLTSTATKSSRAKP